MANKRNKAAVSGKIDVEARVDIASLVNKRLGVDSLPREVDKWIRKKSNGDSSIALQLADALRQTGILQIEEKEKKAMVSLEDPAQPDRLDQAVAMKIDKAIPSLHPALKFASETFASQAIEEIREIQEINNMPPKLEIDNIFKRTNLQAYRVKWDWEIKKFKGAPRGGSPTPAVFRCGEFEDNEVGHYTPLNSQWQFFWFDLCSKICFDGRTHDELNESEYHWLADRWTTVAGNKTAFTNQKGLEKMRNHVMGERMDKEDGAIYTLVCGGATLTGTTSGKNSKGIPMLKVDHFDGRLNPPPVESIDPYTDPRVFFATIITTKPINEGFRVDRFPQFNGKDVPVPLIARSDIYIPLDYLVPIETDKKPSPYYQ